MQSEERVRVSLSLSLSLFQYENIRQPDPSRKSKLVEPRSHAASHHLSLIATALVLGCTRYAHMDPRKVVMNTRFWTSSPTAVYTRVGNIVAADAAIATDVYTRDQRACLYG